MWPDDRLCRLLGVEHPIIQAPMAGSDSPELAAAVNGAGGLGSMGCAMMTPEALEAAMARHRALTNGAVNLNFFADRGGSQDVGAVERMADRLAPWYQRFGLAGPLRELPEAPDFFDLARLEQVLAIAPRVASFHFGLPSPEMIARLKAARILLMSTATTVAEARALQAAGVDAIIAQGYEAGGHRGSHAISAAGDGVGTLALVPQVVDAVSVPVIAAGGIADGRGIAAAFALGASGVQIGSGFLRAREAATDPARRDLLAVARDDDTMVTPAISGRSARAKRSRLAEDLAAEGTDLPRFPTLYRMTGPLLDAGNDEASFHLYGQAAALAREAPAAEIVAALVAETAEVFARLR